jgi:signal transduction histidine kinase
LLGVGFCLTDYDKNWLRQRSRWLHERSELELHVTDEGTGFLPDFVPHAFERFARVEESRSSGGAGLGLAIVAAVATAHGGATAVSKSRGGGADVSIHIPAASHAALARAERASSACPELSSPVAGA